MDFNFWHTDRLINTAQLRLAVTEYARVHAEDDRELVQRYYNDLHWFVVELEENERLTEVMVLDALTTFTQFALVSGFAFGTLVHRLHGWYIRLVRTNRRMRRLERRNAMIRRREERDDDDEQPPRAFAHIGGSNREINEVAFPAAPAG